MLKFYALGMQISIRFLEVLKQIQTLKEEASSLAVCAESMILHRVID